MFVADFAIDAADIATVRLADFAIEPMHESKLVELIL